jgi:hypothetical protein
MTNEERDLMLTSIDNKLSTLITNNAVTEEKVARHDKSLYGNGNPGLCTRLQRIEDKVENNSSRVATIITFVMAASAVIGTLYQIFKTTI